MSRPSTWMLAAALALPAVAGAEEVENPIYKSWSKERPGTVVTHRATTTQAGRTIETTTVYRLVELTEKKAVVEMTVTSDATGTTAKGPPQVFEHKRMFPLFPGVKKEDVGKPSGAIDRGSEAIEIAGKTYKAEWYDTKAATEAGPSLTRTWMADDVPGKLLRAVTKVPKADKVTTLELVSIERP